MLGCRDKSECHPAHRQWQEEGRQELWASRASQDGWSENHREIQKLLGTGSSKMGLLPEATLGLAVHSGKCAGSIGPGRSRSPHPKHCGVKGPPPSAGQSAVMPPPFMLFLKASSQPQRRPSMASEPSKDPYNLTFAEGGCHFQSVPK